MNFNENETQVGSTCGSEKKTQGGNMGYLMKNI